MERVGFVLKVKKGMLDEYKRRHREVWPELLDAIRRNGFRNYSIFLDEEGNLFGYFEAEESFEKCLEGMATGGGQPQVAGRHGRLLRGSQRAAGPVDAEAGARLLHGLASYGPRRNRRAQASALSLISTTCWSSGATLHHSAMRHPATHAMPRGVTSSGTRSRHAAGTFASPHEVLQLLAARRA